MAAFMLFMSPGRQIILENNLIYVALLHSSPTLGIRLKLALPPGERSIQLQTFSRRDCPEINNIISCFFHLTKVMQRYL